MEKQFFFVIWIELLKDKEMNLKPKLQSLWTSSLAAAQLRHVGQSRSHLELEPIWFN